MDQRTRWRIGMGLCVAGSVFLGTAWATGPGRSFIGLLALSFPILVLLYMASFSALQSYGNREEPLNPEVGGRAVKGRTIGSVLVLAGFGWMFFVSSLFTFMGQWQFGAYGFGIAAAFLAGALPGRISNLRIILAFIGLIVISVVLLL